MDGVKDLVAILVRLGIAGAFMGLAFMGLFLMGAVFMYPTGWFWGVIVLLMGALAFLAGFGVVVSEAKRTFGTRSEAV